MKVLSSTTNKPTCGACTRPAYNPSVDGKLIFCGAVTDPNINTAPTKTPLFIGLTEEQYAGKTPKRCPRLYDAALNVEILQGVVMYL
jgi:hypothetical protein